MSLGLLGFLFWLMRDKLPEVRQTLGTANRPLLLTAFVLQTGVVLLMALRLRILMRSMHMPMRYKEVTEITYVGLFFNAFLPTSAGGDVIKAVWAGRSTGKTAEGFAAVLGDRIVGFCALTLLIGFGLFSARDWGVGLGRQLANAVGIGMVAVAGSVLVLSLTPQLESQVEKLLGKLHLGKIGEALHRFITALVSLRAQPKALGLALMLSLVLQSIVIFEVFLLSHALASPVLLRLMFLIVPVSMVAGMVPSVNGMGVRESAFVLLLSREIGPETAFALSLLYLALLFSMSVVGGFVYLLNGRRWI
ncbi:MAG: flippase-like domain-containing protein [Candidatus Omnitrophica bacterium]|nr:flippase-like domain-containing protein [Candidatus Omnitrophota bacterium]